MTEEQQTIQTADKLLKATVKIEPGMLAHGTGFYIARDTILTNEHVIRKANSTVDITRYDGIQCTAKVGYREEGADLALIHTNCLSDNVLTLKEGAKIGESIIVAGNPDVFDFVVSKGIVSSYQRGFIQFDAKVDFGSSGGVVADLSGNVVGVVKSKAISDPYISFAIQSDVINQFLQRAKE